MLLDCVTLWVSNILLEALPSPDTADAIQLDRAARLVDEQMRRFIVWADGFDGGVALVSNEAGMGVVPPYALGRVFRDALGAANRVLAARASAVYLLYAGLAVDLKALGAKAIEALGGPP